MLYQNNKAILEVLNRIETFHLRVAYGQPPFILRSKEPNPLMGRLPATTATSNALPCSCFPAYDQKSKPPASQGWLLIRPVTVPLG